MIITGPSEGLYCEINDVVVLVLERFAACGWGSHQQTFRSDFNVGAD